MRINKYTHKFIDIYVIFLCEMQKHPSTLQLLVFPCHVQDAAKFPQGCRISIIVIAGAIAGQI